MTGLRSRGFTQPSSKSCVGVFRLQRDVLLHGMRATTQHRSMEGSEAVQKEFYPTTIWSEVDRAGRGEGECALAALENLLKKYYAPLESHLRFKFRADAGVAADWLQEFIRQKVLLGKLLTSASRDRGRFRTYLLNSLDNFVVSQVRRGKAQTRCPLGGFVAWEEISATEGGILPGAADPCDLEWARIVIDTTLTRMRAECEEKGCIERWGIFCARLVDPILEGAEAERYEDLMGRFGFESPSEASNALMTAKRQFHRLLREVIGEYAGQGSDVEEELRELMRTLGDG